ncbi:MAG: Gfo/Idh/MocA family oxidoreductase [Planctomycetota bacterium]
MASKTQSGASTRRDFIQSSTLAGGALAAAAMMSKAYAAGGDTIKVGWIGCGGRGSGAAKQALLADKNVKMVAVGDAFQDRLDSGLAALKKDGKVGEKVDVPPERQFVGFDAYKKVIDSDIDVVLLTTPPGFRPEHIRYAIEKGKHVFAEKPVAVDGPGIRTVLAAVDEAKKKKLSIVSGLCWRYDTGTGDLAKHIADGGLGEVMAIQTCYNTQDLWSRPRKEGWSDMEYQMRNWLYYTWLSGDHIVEQNVHNLDRAAWYMKGENPVKVTSLGGRQTRTEEVFGHIYDHFATVFEYANGGRVYNYCRQQKGTDSENGDIVFGTKGKAIWGWNDTTVTGEKPAKFISNLGKAYQTEHDVLFASIRKGEPVNNGDYMCNSTMMGIAGRMAAYTGKALTWKQVMESTESLAPKELAWGKVAFPEIAKPGFTKFI